MSGPPTSSLWHDSLPAVEWAVDRHPLATDTEADVVIVGAGYTGLWTAYYLARRRAVLADRRARGGGRGLRRQRAQRRVVLGAAADELRTRSPPARADTAPARRRGDGPHRRRGRRASSPPRASTATSPRAVTLHVARSTVQADRVRAEVAEHHSFGFGDDDVRWLDADEARGPHRRHRHARCGVHPAVRRRAPGPAGAWVGGTSSTSWRGDPRGHTASSRSSRGRVRAGGHRVDDALRRARHRGVHRDLPGLHRALAPILLADDRHRTAACDVLDDDRSGRSGRRSTTPAAWSSTASEPLTDASPSAVAARRTTSAQPARPTTSTGGVHERLHTTAASSCSRAGRGGQSPTAGAARSARHAIGGARSGCDRATGGRLGRWLRRRRGRHHEPRRSHAGRSDLATSTGTLSSLPWVGHTAAHWEPEPLRWLGINAMLRLPPCRSLRGAAPARPSRWRGT